MQRTHAQEGAPKETLAGVCFYPTDLEADAEHVYWSCQDGTLHWMAAGAEHLERDVGYGKIAIHHAVAYVTDTSRGIVRRIRASDGAVDVLQAGVDRAYQPQAHASLARARPQDGLGQRLASLVVASACPRATGANPAVLRDDRSSSWRATV